jgi:hypothetical protein
MYFEDYFIGQKFYPEPVVITGGTSNRSRGSTTAAAPPGPDHARRTASAASSPRASIRCAPLEPVGQNGQGGRAEVLAGIGIDYLN